MTSKRVAIFWDHASCPPADDSTNDLTLATRLREMCRQYGRTVLFKIYYGSEDNLKSSSTEPEIDMGFALECAGVVTVHRPGMGLSILSTDALCFWADNLGSPCTIVFATANPTLLYTAAALKARGAEVGLIVPPGGLPMDVTPYASWDKDWKSARKNEDALGSSTKALPTPQTSSESTEDTSTGSVGESGGELNHPSSAEDKKVNGPSIKSPTSVSGASGPAAGVTPSVAEPTSQYKSTTERVAQPLSPVEVIDRYQPGVRRVHTTVHDLQILETEPLYIDMIKDPKAMKVKTWRRELKRTFYHDSVAKNPQAPVQLETLFSEIEKYEGMTRNYLAFSRIGKLMTQISQMYHQDFDYRRGYVDRAKTLLNEWENLTIEERI